MKVAALDFGTNTFLLLVAEVTDGKVTRVIHDEAKVVRLGQGVHGLELVLQGRPDAYMLPFRLELA